VVSAGRASTEAVPGSWTKRRQPGGGEWHANLKDGQAGGERWGCELGRAAPKAVAGGGQGGERSMPAGDRASTVGQRGRSLRVLASPLQGTEAWSRVPRKCPGSPAEVEDTSPPDIYGAS